MVKLTHFDINQFAPFTVGFDRVFDKLVDYGNTNYETGGFPPYNIRKTGDFKHVIEIALAGFSKDEIAVVLTDGVLEIKSFNLPTSDKPKKLKDEDMQYSTDRNQWHHKTYPDGESSYGQKTSQYDSDVLIHKGIAKRAFTRKFTLADDIEIKDAKLKNGLLEIELEQIVPEHKKPKTIKVN